MNTLDGAIASCPECACPTAQHQTGCDPRGFVSWARGRSRLAGRGNLSRLQSAGGSWHRLSPRSLFVSARETRALRRDAAMTDRILEFLRNRREDGPCLVLDLDVVRENYMSFASAMPDTRVFYAVKANPDPRVLALLADLGSCFDAASVAEIELALAAGATRRAHQLWQHDQEGARHRARLRAWRSPVRRRLRGRGREGRARRARREGLLPPPLRRRRRRMAAVAQVRLRR